MIVITDFMLDVMRLRGDELLVYAVIYNHCHGSKQRWELDKEYISKTLGLTEQAIDSIIDNLCEKDMVAFENSTTIYILDYE